jgi:hypothetical protein
MICSNVFESLTFGLTEKKTTVKHTCSKCGHVDEEQVKVEKTGLNFSANPSSGIGTMCPWKTK